MFRLTVKDGNIAGAAVSFAVAAFLLLRFLRPKPCRLLRGNSVLSRYDEGFDEGLSAGFFMAENMRQNGRVSDGASTFADDTDENWEEWDEEDC